MKSYGIENPPKTLANYLQMKYNNSPAYMIMKNYMNSVDSGMLSPLAGFENYNKAYERIQHEFIGLITSNGIEIKGQSIHFLERVFGTAKDPYAKLPRNGVELDNIKDALLNGKASSPKQSKNKDGTLKVDQHGNPIISQKFSNSKCEVTINPYTGVLIQCNPKRGG